MTGRIIIAVIEGMVAAWLLDLLLGLCFVTESFSGTAYYRYIMVTAGHSTTQKDGSAKSSVAEVILLVRYSA